MHAKAVLDGFARAESAENGEKEAGCEHHSKSSLSECCSRLEQPTDESAGTALNKTSSSINIVHLRPLPLQNHRRDLHIAEP